MLDVCGLSGGGAALDLLYSYSWGECAECGKRFIPKYIMRPSRFCGQPCRSKHDDRIAKSRRQAKALAKWACRHCNGPWVKRSIPRRALFCSRSCYRESLREPIECVACGEQFLRSAPRQIYCASPCAPVVVYRDDRSGHSHRKRCELYGLPFVRGITRSAIAARDGWDCRLCGYQIDPDLTFPDVMSGSIDHIVPLSLCREGHVWSNVQLAHFTCNSSKGNREVFVSGAGSQAG